MADQRLYALFQDVSDAERAIGALQDHGVPADHIGVVARRAAEQDEAGRVRADYTRLTDRTGVQMSEPEAAYAARPGTLPPAASLPTVLPTSTADTALNVDTVGKSGITTTTPQDAAAGAAVGSGIGLVAGLLLGAAALVVPGVGIVLAGGALAAAVGGAAAAAAAGAVAGGVTGYLRDMGMPEQAAEKVGDRLNEGDYLISVVADSAQYDDLKQLLLKYNATGVDMNVRTAGGEGLADAAASSNAAYGRAAAPAPAGMSTSHPLEADHLTFEPTNSAYDIAARTPLNPALAQEMEPMVMTSAVPSPVVRAPGTTPDEEMARTEFDARREQEALAAEQARTTERETRDAIS